VNRFPNVVAGGGIRQIPGFVPSVNPGSINPFALNPFFFHSPFGYLASLYGFGYPYGYGYGYGYPYLLGSGYGYPYMNPYGDYGGYGYDPYTSPYAYANPYGNTYAPAASSGYANPYVTTSGQGAAYGNAAVPGATMLAAADVPMSGGKIDWPLALRILPGAEPLRKRTDAIFTVAATQAASGKINTLLPLQMYRAVEELQTLLIYDKQDLLTLSSDQYEAAADFLRRLKGAAQTIQAVAAPAGGSGNPAAITRKPK
jgi:hypothetical protein